jgi:protein-tyrosine phosphatase
MAEFLLRESLPADSGWRICSAGVHTGNGLPASREAVKALAEMGIDLTPHRSRALTREEVDASHVIVVMTAAHRDVVLLLYPGAEEKVFLLKSFKGGSDRGDVEDPIGMPVEAYRRTRDEIRAAIPGLAEFLRKLDV